MAHFKLPTEAEDDDGTYTIRYRGGEHPWTITRNRDKYEFGEGYATKDSARLARSRLHSRKVS